MSEQEQLEFVPNPTADWQDLIKTPKMFEQLVPEPPFDIMKVFNICVARIQNTPLGETPRVVFPIHQLVGTKKNRYRLRAKDRASPMGVILKGDAFADQKYYPYAAAKFNAYEVAQWCAQKVVEMQNAKEAQVDEQSEAEPATNA